MHAHACAGVGARKGTYLLAPAHVHACVMVRILKAKKVIFFYSSGGSRGGFLICTRNLFK